MSLAKSLSNDVSTLHDLWRQRDNLTKNQAKLQQDKDKIGDSLFQSEFDQQLEDDFNLLVRTLNKSQAQIEAANRKIEQQELALHTLVPKASHTISRLYVAALDYILDEESKAILDRIDQPDETLQSQVREVITHTKYVVAFKVFQPNLISWLPPLNPPKPILGVDRSKADAIYYKALGLDQEPPLMVRVCKMAEDLSDKAIQILDVIDNTGFKPPPFHLGPEEKPVEVQTEPDYNQLAQAIYNSRSVLTPRQQVIKSLGLENIVHTPQILETIDKAAQAVELFAKKQAEQLRAYNDKRYGQGIALGQNLNPL
jgi:hypothetical protein